jgi:hypothetical protein
MTAPTPQGRPTLGARLLISGAFLLGAAVAGWATFDLHRDLTAVEAGRGTTSVPLVAALLFRAGGRWAVTVPTAAVTLALLWASGYILLVRPPAGGGADAAADGDRVVCPECGHAYLRLLPACPRCKATR